MEKIKEQLQIYTKKFSDILEHSRNQKKMIAYMYLILSFLTLTFFGIFAIRPTLATISELRKEYDENTTVLKVLTEKNQALQQLATQYVQIEPEIALVTDAIPESSKIPELTREIEIISTKSNVAIVKLDIGTIELYPAKKSNPPIFSYSFSIAVNGSENDINTFLSKIVNFNRIISIDRITTGKADKNSYNASLVGRAYFYKN